MYLQHLPDVLWIFTAQLPSKLDGLRLNARQSELTRAHFPQI